MTASPLTTNVLCVWDHLIQFVSLATPVSPLASVGGFLWFPREEGVEFFGPWADNGNLSCGKFSEDGRLPFLETI